MRLIVFIDGAASGNPGPAGIGIVITTEAGTPVVQCGEPIGWATNNVAEYRALLRALEMLGQWESPLEEVTIRSDSQLLVQQLTGIYQVRAAHLAPLWKAAREAIAELGVPVRVEHVTREANRQADRLARLGARMAAQQERTE